MLNNLKPTAGSRKDRTRRCRGIGSGLGKNGGSGNKGQHLYRMRLYKHDQ